MSYSKLIHDYLDGELDATQQDSLFSRMAVDSDVRSEFHQQMKLHVITQSDMGTISPPIESTNAVFSALGFSIPSARFAGAAGLSTAASTGIVTSLWLGLKKYIPYVLTTVVATVITALILFYFFDKYGSKRDDMSSSQRAQIPVIASTEKNAVPNTSAPQGEILTKREIERLFVKTFRETIQNMLKNPAFAYYIPPSQLTNQTNEQFQEGLQKDNGRVLSNKPKTDNSFLSPLVLARSDERGENRLNKYMNLQSAYNTYFDFRDNKDNTRIGLEVRNLNSKSNPDINLPPGASPWFTNLSAALMYEFDRNHSLGVSVGQEQFGQAYTNYKYGIVYTERQNPLLFWYGLSYKLSLPDLLYANVVYPYATVMIGGTTVGPLGKLQLGLQYQPDKRVTFTLGAEASALYYNVQNNIYSTTKYGFTYGIGIHY